MGLKNLFEKMEPAFLPGGKYSKLYPIFESIYTLLYTPGTVTHKNTHVRDALDSKRMMITVFLALFPAIFYGMYNVGNQAIPALNQLGNLDQLISNDWHYALASSLGLDLTNNANLGLKNGVRGDLLLTNLLSGIHRLYNLGIIVLRCAWPRSE